MGATLEQLTSEQQQLLAGIKLVIFDVDGVLTDGQLYFIDNQECKAFHSRDGLGLALLIKAGLEMAIISGNRSASVEARMKKFGLRYLYQGVDDKAVAFQEIINEQQITPAEVAYLGDDLIDLPIMNQVGFAGAVADADEFVITQADWVSQYRGGQGAAREFCELILQAQGQLEHLRQSYLVSNSNA